MTPSPAFDPVAPANLIVTRPGEPGRRLSATLRNRGQAALWWPAFDLQPPGELGALRSLARGLSQFDLAIFVSPAAVRGWIELELCDAWPASTAIAAVGATSLQLALERLPGAGAARVLAPAAGQADWAGSEGLWALLKQQPALAQRVLIVRAESGRDWLAEQLREAGAQVQFAAVYRRVVHEPTDAQRAALSAWQVAPREAAVLVTSSEAVTALDRQLACSEPARRWLREALALYTHARIAQALRTAGYARVRSCEPTADAVQAALAPGRPTRPERQMNGVAAQ